MKTPADMTPVELSAAYREVPVHPVVEEVIARLKRAGKVTETVLSMEFIKATDDLQKAVMATTAYKDSTPELVAAMFAYHAVRVKISEITEGKTA